MTAVPIARSLGPRPRSIALPVLAGWLFAIACGGTAFAQGQESTTSTQAPHTSPHPVPLLSTEDVTSVPSGNPIQGQPLPQEMRPRAPDALGMTGPVAIPQIQLACDTIQDETARTRCEGRTGPAAPPKGLSE
ncbi:hypothetical protein [Microvirga sp. TS319]|uniref:hypothetical protein n=1 Tax=Microvirga sp. TS319 TaxID=3241165 RepID=UPI00351A16DA